MKIVLLLGFVLLVATAFGVPAARAVCFFPHSTLSGYKVPLKTEIGNSRNIAVGTVTGVRTLQEDPSDPAGVTAFIYTVNVSGELKGNIPKQITLRAENDSGGYRMAIGETHLLFLTDLNGSFIVDACGNSTELPKGQNVMLDVDKVLARSPPSP